MLHTLLVGIYINSQKKKKKCFAKCYKVENSHDKFHTNFVGKWWNDIIIFKVMYSYHYI